MTAKLEAAALILFRRKRIPRVAGFRLDVRVAHARRWIGNADQVFAGRALDLPAREVRFALERLITAGTVEFEFVGVHGLCRDKRNHREKSMPQFSAILFDDRIRLVW